MYAGSLLHHHLSVERPAACGVEWLGWMGERFHPAGFAVARDNACLHGPWSVREPLLGDH